ncbi:MAG TPA: hypothetical protein ENK09_00240 [Nitrospirae bacterium]|nr:hypothetical protein [Nitrospirota bacterium]
MISTDGIIGSIVRLREIKDPEEQAKAVAREFESLFINELLKEMDKTLSEGFFGRSFSGSVYQSLFEMNISRTIAERGTGLSEMLEKAFNNKRFY